MKKIPVLALLRSTDESDTRAPYVYFEVTQSHARTLCHALRICTAARPVTFLTRLKRLSRLAIDGPGMWALEAMPKLTEAQQRLLKANDAIILDECIDNDALPHSDVRLCGEELHVFAHGGVYAVAQDKHSRDIFEADLNAVATCLTCKQMSEGCA